MIKRFFSRHFHYIDFNNFLSNALRSNTSSAAQRSKKARRSPSPPSFQKSYSEEEPDDDINYRRVAEEELDDDEEDEERKASVSAIDDRSTPSTRPVRTDRPRPLPVPKHLIPRQGRTLVSVSELNFFRVI